MVSFCTVYQKLMFTVYNTEIWCLFDIFMKVMLNQSSHKERSFERNLAFNFLRCFSPVFLDYTVYEIAHPTHLLILHAVAVVFFTWIVQNHCTRKAFKNNANEWVALKVFYIISYGMIFLNMISRVEIQFHSNIARTMSVYVVCCTGYLYADLIEDFFFNDLGAWGGIWHNWSYFVYPTTTLVLTYFLTHFYVKFDITKGALRHESGMAFSIKHYQMPLVWPSTHFRKHEDENWIVVLMANTVYAYITLYYSIQWKSEIKVGKPKKVSLALLENVEF